MEFKDYYKIMGVSADATPEQIKQAYRKLARKYHPDVSKEANAEMHFKEMQEAYEALKDPEKRKAYDQLRKGGWREGQTFTPPPNWQFEGDFKGEEFTQANGDQFSDFFDSLFGQAGMGGRGQRSFRMRGEDIHYSLAISLEEAYHGATRSIQLVMPEIDAKGRRHETVRTLNVKIPAGVIAGQQIRLRGQGGSGNGAENGDLYLKIQLQPHPLYHPNGRDLMLTLPITPWEAALGALVDVSTLGGQLKVKIPAGSQTGAKLRLKGRGLPGNPSGNLYVILRVVIPQAHTEAAKALYRQMAQTIPFNPREKLGV